MGRRPPTDEEMRAPRARIRRGGSVVYFIRGTNLIKIGCSDDPEARLKALQIGSPAPLRIVASISGGYELERTLHARFVKYRAHGEWFHAADEILSYLQEIQR